MALIIDPAIRQKRVHEKQTALLRFLRAELYTTAAIAAYVLGLDSRQAVHKTLTKMERDCLLCRATVTAPSGKKTTLWGITAHGQGLAFLPDEGEQIESRTFEPGRVGLTVLEHTLDTQRLRLVAERAGWIDWTNADRMGKWQADQKRPDALATLPDGRRAAIECERTIKTLKRYESILASYLQALKRGEIQLVIWTSPTPELATRLRVILTSIQTVSVAGQRIRVDPQRHHTNLRFVPYNQLTSIN